MDDILDQLSNPIDPELSQRVAASIAAGTVDIPKPAWQDDIDNVLASGQTPFVMRGRNLVMAPPPSSTPGHLDSIPKAQYDDEEARRNRYQDELDAADRFWGRNQTKAVNPTHQMHIARIGSELIGTDPMTGAVRHLFTGQQNPPRTPAKPPWMTEEQVKASGMPLSAFEEYQKPGQWRLKRIAAADPFAAALAAREGGAPEIKKTKPQLANEISSKNPKWTRAQVISEVNRQFK